MKALGAEKRGLVTDDELARCCDRRAEIVAAVREFVDREVMPVARERRADEYPAALVAAMRELGLFGVIIPEQFGGLGLDLATYAADRGSSRAAGCPLRHPHRPLRRRILFETRHRRAEAAACPHGDRRDPRRLRDDRAPRRLRPPAILKRAAGRRRLRPHRRQDVITNARAGALYPCSSRPTERRPAPRGHRRC